MAEAILALDQHPADAVAGFELGWDHARWGITPPAEHLVAGNPVRLGWQAGRASFGQRRMVLAQRTPAAQAAVRDWLELRLAGWLRGLHVEALTVTPHHLQQLQVSHCPVTRAPLRRDPAGPRDSAPQITRLCDEAGYAAGHLAMLSTRAAAAQDGLDFAELYEHARRMQGDPVGQPGRYRAPGHALGTHLTALQWARLALLRSFVTPLPHAQAAVLPLLVLPPNRLRLRNPIQGLQVLVTLLLARSGWSKRLPQLEALMPHAQARRELRAFFTCLMAKAIAAGRPGDPQAKRWALEDAWRQPQVQAHWRRFALQLDATTTDALLARAVDAGLAPGHAHMHSDAQATEGWQLAPQAPAGSVAEAISAWHDAVPRREAATCLPMARAFGRPRLHRMAPGAAAPQQLALPM